MCLTVVPGQAPARGHTLHASGEVVCALSHAHGGNTRVHLGGRGQLDEQDVVVDGEAVVVGVFEDLTGNDLVRVREHEAVRSWAGPTFPTPMVWMASALEERSCSPMITRWDVLQRQEACQTEQTQLVSPEATRTFT